MKRILLLIMLFALFFSLPAVFTTGYADGANEVEYSAYSGFEAKVSGTPSYMRIRMEFGGALTNAASAADFKCADKAGGITDAFFVNGYSLEEHAERGNNVMLRIYGGADAHIAELRYYFNSADFKGEMRGGEFAVAAEGLDTGYARLKEGFALVYYESGWAAYTDSTVSALKTVFLSRFNALAEEVSGYSYGEENARELSSVIAGYRAGILSAGTAAATAGVAVKGMAEIREFAEIYAVVPIEITKMEKAYRYPNGDISFKVFLSENYSDNWYAHVTLEAEELRGRIGEYGWFYTDDTIDKFVKYGVRESILKNLSVNGFTLMEITENEGENGLKEPVRVDFEIGNAFTGYYCFQVYIDGKSKFAEEYAPDLSALCTFAVRSGARFIDYTVNAFTAFVFDNSLKSWAPADSKAATAYMNKLSKLHAENLSEAAARMVAEAKAALEGLSLYAPAEEYAAAIALAGRAVTFAGKTVYLAEAGEVISSAVQRSGGFAYLLEVPFFMNGEKVSCTALAVRSDLNTVLLNGAADKLSVYAGSNGNLVIEIPLSNLVQGENAVNIIKGFSLSDNTETSADILIVQKGNAWRLEGGGGTYTVTVNSPRAAVEGKRELKEGESGVYLITANDGYEILSVLLDGEEKGAVSRLTIENACGNHVITVTCREMGSSPPEGKKGCKGAMETVFPPLASLFLAAVFFRRAKPCR